MRKYVLAALTIICVFACALGIAACVPSDIAAHNWSKEWTHSFEKHWHKCSDPGCAGITGEAEHTWKLVEDMVETEPTCGTYGWGRYYCTVCGATKDDDIPFEGTHDFKLLMNLIEPTCGEAGKDMYACTVCGEVESRDVAATGEHDFSGSWQSSEEGHYKVCSVCGEKDQVVPHVAADTPTTIRPQSSYPYHDGKTTLLCKDCGYEMQSETIPNPYVAVSFDISLQFKADNSLAEINENGETVLWAERSPTNGYDGNANRRYTISFVNAKNREGTSASISADYVKAFYVDEYSGEPTPIDTNFSKIMYMAGTFAITQFYPNPNRDNSNEYTIVFRYYCEDEIKAEKTLFIEARDYLARNVRNAMPVLIPENDQRRRAA